MMIAKIHLVAGVAAAFAVCSPSLARSADDGKSAAATSIAGAEKSPQLDELTPIKLTLYPAKPPAATAQVPLLPRFSEQTPGNAATLYLKALMLLADSKDGNDYWEKIYRWLEMPPDKLPRADVRAALQAKHNILHDLTLAAHRDHCDWDPPLREDENVFMILLPEWQHLRFAGAFVALKARLEIAEGHPADALATLQTGYSMARHVGNCPILVCGLVGIAISGMMDEQFLTLVESPNCPNLYWSLTALPNPLIDLRPALDFESESIFFSFPELRDVDHAEHSTAEWDRILGKLTKRYATSAIAVDDKTALGAATLVASQMIAKLPRAKDDLVAAGRDRKTVDAMPASQVTMLDTVLVYKQARDDMFKWFNLPYWQSRDGFAAIEKQLKTELREREIIPLASIVLPTIGHVRTASVRSERRIALLRTIEALRNYAAEHDGRLPQSLDDITATPVPVDPVSGKAFEYKLNGGTAQLVAPPPTGETWESLGVRYEITIAAKK